MEMTLKDAALKIAQIAQESKGEDVVVLDVSSLCSWTDFFVLVTVTSSVQKQGLLKRIGELLPSAGLKEHTVGHKTPQGDDWNIVDLGAIVIHLMSGEAREFYDLETLWQAAPRLVPQGS